MGKLIYLYLSILLAITFYLRINFYPFYQHFGFYQGDIWYFYSFYGEKIRNSFFFQIEYPIGYVLIQKFTLFLSNLIFQKDIYENFLLSNALLIIPSTLGLAGAMSKIAQHLKLNTKKIFPYLLLSPSLFLYTSINYDIFPVLLVTLSALFLLKNKVKLSFFFLSLGTVIKFYPVFLLPLFILYALSKEKITKIVSGVFIFVVTFFLINLPYLLYNKTYWLFPYTYQSINPERVDPTTLSYFLFIRTGLERYQLFLLPILLLVSYIISFVFFKRKKLTDKNFLYLIFLGTLSIVLGNHVYVPQYFLWFFPFLALTGIPALAVWLPLDFINGSTRFFYFKLLNDFKQIFIILREATVFYYLFIYILLIYYVIKLLNTNEN